jgi:hypothetical protein
MNKDINIDLCLLMKEELIRCANKIRSCFLVWKHINLLKWQIRLKEWALEQIDRSASLQAIHSMKKKLIPSRRDEEEDPCIWANLLCYRWKEFWLQSVAIAQVTCPMKDPQSLVMFAEGLQEVLRCAHFTIFSKYDVPGINDMREYWNVHSRSTG